MSKHTHKSNSNPRDNTQERISKKAREIQERLGLPDIEVYTGTKIEGKERIKTYHSTKFPKVNIGLKKQPLEIEVSSIDQENESLLHLLFNKAQS